MIHPITRSLVILTALLFAFAGRSAAQEKTIKKVPIESTSPGSGAEMFKAYCAVCHGKDAKGGGPAAEALKVQPPEPGVSSKTESSVVP